MKLTENHTLEQILESAVVASWQDLMNGAQPGLIHIEYDLTAGGNVDDLRIWSSIARGHWLLVCEYGTSASKSHSSGVRFDNGYHSESLAHTLEFVIQHQNAFALPPNLGRPGLLQIPRHGSRNRSGCGLDPRSLRPCQLRARRTCPGLTSASLRLGMADRWENSGQCGKPRHANPLLAQFEEDGLSAPVQSGSEA